MKKLALIIAILFSVSVNYGQIRKQIVQKKSSTTAELNNTNGLIFLDEAKNYSSQKPEKIFQEVYNTPSTTTFKLVREESDKLGFLHQKYQEYYNGVKVEYGIITLHSKEGKAISITSEYYPVSGMNDATSLSKEQAFEKAVSHIGAQHYLWENAEMAKVMDDYKKPEGELVVLPVFSNTNISENKVEAYRLAYKFDIYATSPISRGNIYMDAITGEALLYDAIIKHANNKGFEGAVRASAETEESFCERIANEDFTMLATGTAATRYSGSQSITTRIISGSYRLRDDTRGSGINTYNSGRTPTYPNTNFSDSDNNWTAGEFDNANKDNAALDAHWGAEKTYDYWLNVHSRNSFNNAGAAINSWVHYDDVVGNPGYNNAFWNGSVMTYGDGSCGYTEGCSGFDALTSIDVAGHEIGSCCNNIHGKLSLSKRIWSFE